MLTLGICFTGCYSFFFFKQKTAYEMRISDWSSDVCSSDLLLGPPRPSGAPAEHPLCDCVPHVIAQATTALENARVKLLFSRPIAALAALLMAVPAQADALIDNVNGITLDEDGDVVHFTGLLMTTDGRITKLLGRKDKRPEKLDWRTDMHGKVMLPGFVDAHGHIMDLGFRSMELDLSDTHSLAEAQAKIAAYAEANPERTWILGGGWDQEKWGLGRFPTAAELDGVAGGRPIALTRIDSPAVWVNSAAPKAEGITPATKAPPGERTEKQREKGGEEKGG